MPRKKRKAPSTSKEQEKDQPQGWWDLAEPLGEFLPKFIGFNFFHLHDEGTYSKATFDDREVESVNFKAEFLELSDLDGKELADSPDEPVEGIVSIPLSVMRKIRAWIEENVPDAVKAKEKVLMDKILRLQKTGKDKATRYPTVRLYKPEEYYED